MNHGTENNKKITLFDIDGGKGMNSVKTNIVETLEIKFREICDSMRMKLTLYTSAVTTYTSVY